MLKKSSRMLTVNIVIVRGGSRNFGEGGGVDFFFKGMGSGGRLKAPIGSRAKPW